MSLYRTIMSKQAKRDLKRISRYIEKFYCNKDKVVKKLYADIDCLTFMPRIHKTIFILLIQKWNIEE